MRLQRGCETLGINARPGVTPLWVIPEVPLEAKFPAVVLRTLKCTPVHPKMASWIRPGGNQAPQNFSEMGVTLARQEPQDAAAFLSALAAGPGE